ncbi:MAG TPA: pyridoxal phosphate-dependent aminotransferase [Puia sp.]|jgi:aspartate/methionine/tyrosine aminotransferase
MQYKRMPIEVESPEQMGYDRIRNNLSESSYTDTFLRDIDLGMGGIGSATGTAGVSGTGSVGESRGTDWKDLILAYGSHAGHDGLRDLIAKDSYRLAKEDVLLTVGAAAGLFIIATTLLEKGDELIVVRPNYATNIETPKAIGARIRYVDLNFDDGFALDIEKIKSLLTPQTKYISVTHPHNPTGICLTAAEIKELAAIAEDNNIRLLVDETYRDMVFAEQLPLAAEISPNVISISSLSKSYGLPGIRVGWILCRDQALMETFLAAKEQIHICGSVLDEEVAYRYLLNREKHLQRIKEDILRKFNIVKTWMNNQDQFEWMEPDGGCVCFPRMRHPEKVDIDRFYDILLKKYGTYTGPGHWFDMPRHYMRVGFGWPAVSQLEEGLDALLKSLGEATRPVYY